MATQLSSPVSMSRPVCAIQATEVHLATRAVARTRDNPTGFEHVCEARWVGLDEEGIQVHGPAPALLAGAEGELVAAAAPADRIRVTEEQIAKALARPSESAK